MFCNFVLQIGDDKKTTWQVIFFHHHLKANENEKEYFVISCFGVCW